MSPPAQASTRCLLCGLIQATSLARVNGFHVVRCERCHLVFVEGWDAIAPPEDLYGPTYFRTEGISPLGYHDYVAQERLHLRNARPLLRILEAVTPGRQLLDVGCAHGFFLAAARDRGFHGRGVDLSGEAVEYARHKLGLDVVKGDLAGVRLAEGSFDAVTLIGSIEHVPDPLTTLRDAARLLKPRGHVLITTLDIEGALRQWEWKPPEHLFYFSFRSLARVIEAAGLEVLWRRWYWAWYAADDLAGRLLRHWSLPGALAVPHALEWAGLDRVAVKIPTNGMIVLARKR